LDLAKEKLVLDIVIVSLLLIIILLIIFKWYILFKYIFKNFLSSQQTHI
jgi:hypothetical protein